MERFVIFQPHSDSWRAIDNGKTFHNLSTTAYERVHTTSAEWCIAAAKGIRQHTPDRCNSTTLEGGVEDEEGAYRCVASMDAHECVNVVGFFHAARKQVVYLPLRANAFCLSSSVHNYNRLPGMMVCFFSFRATVL